MLNIVGLFGRSPFNALQTHLDRVAECVLKLQDLFDALDTKDYSQVEKVAATISKLEHDADLIKVDIRNHLPKSLFLSIDRSAFLEMVSLQDALADTAEDVAIITTLKPLEFSAVFREPFKEFFKVNLDTFLRAQEVMKELSELIEASFGGVEADRVREMVSDVAYREHKADLVQRELLRALYSSEDTLHFTSFNLWTQIFERVGDIANISEKLCYRVEMILEL